MPVLFTTESPALRTVPGAERGSVHICWIKMYIITLLITYPSSLRFSPRMPSMPPQDWFRLSLPSPWATSTTAPRTVLRPRACPAASPTGWQWLEGRDHIMFASMPAVSKWCLMLTDTQTVFRWMNILLYCFSSISSSSRYSLVKKAMTLCIYLDYTWCKKDLRKL